MFFIRVCAFMTCIVDDCALRRQAPSHCCARYNRLFIVGNCQIMDFGRQHDGIV